MTEEEIELHKQAVTWVKENINDLYSSLIAGRTFDNTSTPAASFMAGTPGAGKTEFSKRLIENFSVKPLRIDTDELREKIPGYNGKNSRVVQGAASLALDKILDKVLHNKFPFILDTTFSIGRAVQNLKRASRKGYSLQLYFIYQDPVQAWEVTRAREVSEGRNVPKEAFIEAYFNSKLNCKRAKEEFGDKLELTLVIKNYKEDTEKVHYNVAEVDKYLPRIYTSKTELGGLIND